MSRTNPEQVDNRILGAMVARDTITSYRRISGHSADLMVKATLLSLAGSSGQTAAEGIIMRYTSDPVDERLKGLPVKVSPSGLRKEVVSNLGLYLSWHPTLRNKAALWMTQDSKDR